MPAPEPVPSSSVPVPPAPPASGPPPCPGRVIAFRRTCDATGTGLSHYVFLTGSR